MSRLTPPLLLLALLAAAACMDEPPSASPPAQLAQTAPDSFGVRLVDRADEEEFVLLIGPKDVPVSRHAEGTGHHGVLPEPHPVRIPKDVYLMGFRYELVDGEGNAVPSEVLHHMNVINPEKRELFLPISQRMLAVGKETGARSMPGWLMGYPVEAGTEPAVSVMLHNPTDEDLHDVTVRLVLEYEEAGGLFPLFAVYPFQMDVSFPVGDKQFDLPPGRSEFSWTGSPALEGRIMVVGSHLHEHAERIRLEDVTDDELLWEGYPVENEQGELQTVTVGDLYWTLGEPLDPEHEYRATVVYDNPTDDTLPGGGMGVVAGAFLPEAGSWPEADTTSHLYTLDRRHYLRQTHGPLDGESADSLLAAW